MTPPIINTEEPVSAWAAHLCDGVVERLARRAARALAMVALLLAACSGDPGYQGRSSQEWIEALEDSTPEVRQGAADALGRILRIQPRSPRVVEALIRALGDPDDHVRVAAGVALATEGVRAPSAIPGLIDALQDSLHPHTREHAAQILGAFGPSAHPAVPALTLALADSSDGVRSDAAAALGQIGPAAASATQALVRLAADPRPTVRRSAISALGRVAAPEDTVVPLFATALATDSSADVRVVAAYALAALGEKALPGISAAVQALAHPAPTVRRAAANALEQFGPGARAAIPALTAATRDGDAAVAGAAVRALAAVQGRPQPPRPHPEP